MSIDLLLQEFNRVSDTPEAISRLRAFITDLAVIGTLEEQDVSEAPPEEAQQIAQQSSASGELPQNWVCARIGDLLDVTYGKGLPASERAESGPVAVYGSNGVVSYTSKAMVNQSAIIVGRKGSAGALVIAIGPSWTTDVAYYIVPPSYYDIGFLFLQLKSLRLESLSKGVKPGLSRSDMNPLQLAVPPLAEQHRIVAKVDDLMSLCDQLEWTQKEREVQRAALRGVSLYRLASPQDDATDIATDVHFFLDQSPRLITKPEHVTAMRQTILGLAMRGQLVPENVDDEPVDESLASSDEVRAAIAAGDRRADARQQELLNPELRWEVPAHWEWRGLADLVLFIDYRGRTPEKIATGVRLITAKNVRRGYIELEPQEFVSETEYDRWMTRGLPEVGDVLFTTEAPMGNAAVVRLSEKFALAQRVIDFRPYGSIDPDFLMLQLTSEPFREVLDATATGLTAKGIKAAKLKRLPTAVPPLGEQRRIAAKVGELMSVCDELEASLESAQAERGGLLEALLQDALVENSRTETSIEAVV